MVGKTKVARFSRNGIFAPGKVGAGKASKFALVEGLSLDAKSKAASVLAHSNGLKGDAYRASVAGHLLSKRNK